MATGSAGAEAVGTTIAGPADLGSGLRNETPGWLDWAEAQAALSRTTTPDSTVLRILHLDIRGPRNRVARVYSACPRIGPWRPWRANRAGEPAGEPGLSLAHTGGISGRAGVPALYRMEETAKWSSFAGFIERITWSGNTRFAGFSSLRR